MNKLWIEYFNQIMNFNKNTDFNSKKQINLIGEKLSKIDFHGSILHGRIL